LSDSADDLAQALDVLRRTRRDVRDIAECADAALSLGEHPVPACRGIYAVWCDDGGWLGLLAGYDRVVDDGGVARAPTTQSDLNLPADGLLYIGKAERSLRARDWRTHFCSGKTHQSTLRRSLAALLGPARGWAYEPRNGPSRLGAPVTRIAARNFRLASDAQERELTDWMHRHLALGWAKRPDEQQLAALEERLVREKGPPLNLTHAIGDLGRAAKAARARIADDLEIS
jgi:hypothetical protein